MSALFCRVSKEGVQSLHVPVKYRTHGFDIASPRGWTIVGDLFSKTEISVPSDFAKVDGEFFGLTWSKNEGSVAVVADKMGVFPIFYCRHGGDWLFSTHASRLLAEREQDPRPNIDFLARYLLQNIMPLEVIEESLFEGVFRLPASHYAQINEAGELKIRRYWDFDCTQDRKITAEEATDQFRELLTAAVSNRLGGGKTGISISGGLDSSAIFCVASKLSSPGESRLKGISYTSEHRESDETAFVHDVELKTGRQIEKFPIADHLGFAASIEDQVLAVEAPFTDQLWGVTRTLYERTAQQNCTRLLSGHWGDQVLFTVSYLADALVSGDLKTFWQHFNETPKWIAKEEWDSHKKYILQKAIKRVLPPLVPLVRKLRGLRARAGASAGLFTEEFVKKSAPTKNSQWSIASVNEYQRDLYLQARSSYHQDCLDWNFKVSAHFGNEIRFPLYDEKLISFLLKIQGKLQNMNGRPRGILRDSLAGILPESVRGRTWKSDFSIFVNRTLQAEFQAIEGLFGKDAMVFELGILDRKKTAAAVAGMRAAAGHEDCNEAWAIADLAALEIWLKTYIKGEKIWQRKRPTKAEGRPNDFRSLKSNALELSRNLHK